MNKQAIIERTIKAIQGLPVEKAEEISDFADFLIKRHEEQSLIQGIQKLTSAAASFQFLHEEEEVYSSDDLKEVYNG
ncbi:hypothetical protein DSL64_19665 [Dyadobacter luteus]|jgi:hypothetical protein|uniref:DUF2281 domain-containing protein n=1 Tax=Dyadobacter luteus TaxID=2259619 RepID=A0A3D8Y7G5_9BACT|nr:hypothetical protein [Dyadobacter luteus]REA58888.1 hypothetical protein DSL64_19665 [Dyadobacter luteus]